MQQQTQTRNMHGACKAPGTVLPPMNYFAIPGLTEAPVKPTSYQRESSKVIEPRFTPEVICQVATQVLKTTPKALRRNCRRQNKVDNRCIVAWLCYKYAANTGMRKIANLIGRDRSTAIHLVHRANNALETGNEKFTKKLKLAEKVLLGQ